MSSAVLQLADRSAKLVLDDVDEASSGQVLVSRQTPQQVMKHVRRQRRELRCKTRWCAGDGGSLWLHELPSLARDELQAKLLQMIEASLGSSVTPVGGFGCECPGIFSREVDCALMPTAAHAGPVPRRTSGAGRWPSVVFDFGHAATLQDLHDAAEDYLHPTTGTAMYVGVRIFNECPDGTRPMLCVRYRRRSADRRTPDLLLSFGTAPLPADAVAWVQARGLVVTDLTADGDDCARRDAVLEIPTADVFYGTDAPADAPATLSLDLCALRSALP